MPEPEEVACDPAGAGAAGRMFPPMKLAALQALVLAIELGSVRSAARQLGLSQPALSKMLRELELELGAPLLLRTHQGVAPTAQGRVLHEHARRVSKELVDATQRIHQMGGQMEGELNVGAVPLAIMLLIPETLRSFCREFPNIKLRVHEEMHVAQLQQLRTGALDIVVGGIPQGLANGEFLAEPLLDTEMVVAAERGSPWGRARSLAELREARWIYTNALGDTGYARALFEQHAMQAPPVGAVVNSTLTLLSLLATGDFVGLMPEQAMRHRIAREFLCRVPVAEPGLRLRVGAIIRNASAVAPAVQHFMRHLHQVAARHAQSDPPGPGPGPA